MTADAGSGKATRWPLWGLLLFCGGISLTLSVAHALGKVADGDRGGALVACLIGIAPVIAAALLAHLITDPYAAKGLKAGVGTVFLGAMTLSVSAQAETVTPILGHDLAILFPLVLDLSTVMALLALAGVGYSYRAERQRAELRAELAGELRHEFATREAELRRELGRNSAEEAAAREAELRQELEAELREELAAAQSELRRELEDEHRAAVATREAELRQEFTTLLKAAETKIRERAETEVEDRVRRAVVETQARMRLELGKAGKDDAKTQTRAKAIEPSGKAAGESTLSKKEQARLLLERNPEISGAELGRALGVTERYGCKLLAQLTENSTDAVHLRAVT